MNKERAYDILSEHIGAMSIYDMIYNESATAIELAAALAEIEATRETLKEVIEADKDIYLPINLGTNDIRVAEMIEAEIQRMTKGGADNGKTDRR